MHPDIEREAGAVVSTLALFHPSSRAFALHSFCNHVRRALVTDEGWHDEEADALVADVRSHILRSLYFNIGLRAA